MDLADFKPVNSTVCAKGSYEHVVVVVVVSPVCHERDPRARSRARRPSPHRIAPSHRSRDRDGAGDDGAHTKNTRHPSSRVVIHRTLIADMVVEDELRVLQ